MTDVLPIVLVGADEDLVVELISGHGERRHVRRKLKKRGKAVHTDETQSGRERFGKNVFARASQDEAPFAERWDVHVIGIGLQAGLLQRMRDAPEGIAGEHGRGALHDHESLGAEVAGDGAVERRGVKLAERIIRGVGKIDDDEIETVRVRIDPGECIRVDDVHAGGKQRLVIEIRQHRVRRKNPGHLGIEIDQSDALDLRILQDFTNGEAVAPAENQDAAWSRDSGQAGMDKRFMVAVFVAGAELQMTVEKKAQVILEAGEDEMLVVSVAGKYNLVGVDIVFGGGGDLLRLRDCRAQCAQDNKTSNAQTARGGKLIRKKESAPKRDAGVDQAE